MITIFSCISTIDHSNNLQYDKYTDIATCHLPGVCSYAAHHSKTQIAQRNSFCESRKRCPLTNVHASDALSPSGECEDVGMFHLISWGG